MNSYLTRLKNIDADNYTNTHYIEPTELTKGAFDSFVSDDMEHIVINKSDIEEISNWWLIHFIDLESVQIAIWPPCNHSDALAFNPTAIAAEPIASPIVGNVNMELITNE